MVKYSSHNINMPTFTPDRQSNRADEQNNDHDDDNGEDAWKA